MLRHRSDDFGLDMDPYGFVALDAVVGAVQERYSEVGEGDIRDLVGSSRQRRFEITDSGIRALYGHSFFVEMDGDPIEPPDRLYTWCATDVAERYRREGMKPVDRYYVHLSLSRQAAESRARNVDAPCVVEVLAREAHAEGVKFFARGEVVLTLEIPSQFVGEVAGLEPQADATTAARPDPGTVTFGRKPRRDNRRR